MLKDLSPLPRKKNEKEWEFPEKGAERACSQ